jgi:hypothetical protein
MYIYLFLLFNIFVVMAVYHTVKKDSDFPVPSWDITYQTLPGRE